MISILDNISSKNRQNGYITKLATIEVRRVVWLYGDELFFSIGTDSPCVNIPWHIRKYLNDE